MNVNVLGPVEASVDGRPVELGAGKQRALLAILALHAGETVSTERLIDGLWSERPPATATKLVQLYISQLRKALAASGDGSAIVTRGHGYELRLTPDDVDVARFERLVSAGAPREALALWRGRPLDDVAGEPFAAVEIRRLEELRLFALEQAIDADLAAGRHREIVGELDALVVEEPLRERLHAQRMLALYRSGRQADALEAYREARRALVDQVGVEPGPELRRFHEAILRQDPTLATPATEAAELPPELDAATPLLGREADLDWVREQWRAARAGVGSVVLVAGPQGMGKSRLAAELAAEVHRDGAEVLYASCAGPPATALSALERVRVARRAALLVLDDEDRAGGDVRGALDALREELDRRPALVLVLATACDPRVRADATLRLGPLDESGVAAVARLYRQGDAPVELLMAASGGVPARVHRAAREQARATAIERVGEAVERAAGERARLRAAEAEVAIGVEELQVVSERAPEIVTCPFKGLASFDVDDASVFFGRDRLVAELVARLAGAPLMAMVGPSGSGKSSALRAGLLAALAGGVLPGSERWPIALLRPGEHPLRALEQAVAGIEGRSVVAVDQFEELFTACRHESERAAFVDAVVARARETRRQTLVVIAVRADFYGHCAAFPELARLAGANHVLVGPMRRDELRCAIELPARSAGLRVDPQLVDALVADVADEPGALPLLSSSMLELWQRRDGRRLRFSAYDEAGGVRRAVARLAERAYARLSPERREVARRILLRLAGEGEGDAVVRRRVPLSELEGAGVSETLAVLADERLVTIGDGAVEVAHEALLREWPRLRGWLEEDADGRRLHAHVTRAARDWLADGRDAGELYRGARLAAALDWAAAHASELNEAERTFLEASRSAADREAERQRRANHRLRALLASLAVLLALAVAAGVAAISQRGEARDAALAADAQRLGAMALAEDDLDRALLLARQGVALHDSPLTRSNLLAALLKSPAAIGVLRGDGDRLIGLDLSPDGRTLAFVDHDGTLVFLDTRTRRAMGSPVRVPGLEGVIVDAEVQPDVRFSPDGALLAVGGGQPTLFDARTRRPLARLRVRPDSITYGLTFSPDGRDVIARTAWPPHWGTYITRLAVPSGEPLGPPRQVKAEFGFVALMAMPDGRVVTTAAREGTVIRDAETLAPVRRVAAGGEPAALARDDRTMVAGDADGSVRFIDLATGKVRPAATRHEGAVVRAAFGPDGTTAVTAGEDGRLIAWDVATGEVSETLSGQNGRITGLAINRDGSTLYSSALDGRVFIWDLTGARRLGRPFDAGTGNDDAGIRHALSSDGAVLAVGNGDGTVTVLDARTLRVAGIVRIARGSPARGMGFVPGGRLLVVGDGRGHVSLVDTGALRVVKRWRAHRGGVYMPGLSADGRVLATASGDDGSVRTWALPSGRALGPPRRYDGIGDIDLSPDGRTLAVTHPPTHGVDILEVPSLRRRGSLAHARTVWDVVSFTRDGRFLVGGSFKGWVRLWSTTTLNPVTRILAGHAGRVEWVSMSPDGRTLATGGPEPAIRLWDLRSQQPFGAPLPGLPGRGLAPTFTPDGAYLFAVTDAGIAYRWDVRPASWARYACAVAGRTLTRDEWAEALSGRRYAPACRR